MQTLLILTGSATFNATLEQQLIQTLLISCAELNA